VVLLGLWGCPDAAVVLTQLKEAQADSVDHMVTYSGNGATSGAVPVDHIHYRRGELVTVLGNGRGLAWYGRTYSGWNTEADGSGTTYTQGQTFTMGTSDVTLYAAWTILPTYAVTYDANGVAGSVPTDATNYLQGQSVHVLGNSGNLANPPLGFDGWNTKPDGSGLLYSQGQTFAMGTTDVTLYARWVTAYTMTYDANGATSGDVPVDSMYYPQGHAATVSGNTGSLARTGLAFGGWNTSADGSGSTYRQGNGFAMGAENATLYAKWVPTCTVTYDGNGATSGSVPVDAALYAQGDQVTVLSTGDLARDFYWCPGWKTQADGNGMQLYTPGQSFTITSDVRLYAHWVPFFQ
jgi:hypothetical protein